MTWAPVKEGVGNQATNHARVVERSNRLRLEAHRRRSSRTRLLSARATLQASSLKARRGLPPISDLILGVCTYGEEGGGASCGAPAAAAAAPPACGKATLRVGLLWLHALCVKLFRPSRDEKNRNAQRTLMIAAL